MAYLINLSVYQPDEMVVSFLNFNNHQKYSIYIDFKWYEVKALLE